MPGRGRGRFLLRAFERCRVRCRNRSLSAGFAGSETIRGFEERSFDSRVASDQAKASTLRTPRAAPVIFLHLRIAVADGRLLDFLISDRSGEHFNRALDTPAKFADFEEIGRADTILLLIDGEQLLNNHQVETARLRKLVVALSQAGHLTDKVVHLVVTKADLLNGESQRTQVEQRAKVISDELGRRSSNCRTQTHLTSCRPLKGQTTFGQGIQKLLEVNVPEAKTQVFNTTHWNPGDGGTPLDRLMRVEKWL